MVSKQESRVPANSGGPVPSVRIGSYLRQVTQISSSILNISLVLNYRVN